MDGVIGAARCPTDAPPHAPPTAWAAPLAPSDQSMSEGQVVQATPAAQDSRAEAGLDRGAAGFDAWVRAHDTALLRFAAVTCGDAERGADALQEALSALYPRWNRVIARGDPLAYVRRSVVNGHVSWWRRIGRREITLPTAERRAEHRAHPVVPTTNSADPAEVVAAAGLARDLLATLPPRQRGAIALRYLDDLSFAEIGAVLDCPEATARSYVHRALRRLRHEIGDDHD